MTPADAVAQTRTTHDITAVRSPDVIALVYERLLVPNFPGEERLSVDRIIDAVANGTSTLRVVGALDDPVAMAITQRLTKHPVELLAYFATRTDRRGRGVGTRLLTSIIDAVRSEPGATLLLAEVEHPSHHDAHVVHGDPVARVRFYGRLGARVLDLPYFQAPVGPGADAVFGMALLALDVPDALVRDGRLIADSGIADAVDALIADADPRRHPMAVLRRAAAEAVGVALVPIERIAEVALPTGD